MKPKYYSCFFLSLFACDQGNIQDTDLKDNLLDGPASTELINNFCQKVKDINDENDPSACVESINKLVGKYANNFWSLERCQGIFKQLCEQVPSYPSQIVYDVLYALLKNKCLDAVGVRTIIQGIEENNPKVFSLLNNYVCLNRSRVNETDEPDRIIAESFGFILNKTIFIPGINTFTSTPIPQQKKEITIDDLTNIWQCVRFIINNNGFDTNSLKKLIKLASSEDFNEAIKAIADAGIFFKDSGDEMMNAFDGENVNLNDAGLQALANCIQDAKQIVTTQNVKDLIPSLQNCKHLAPIFNKCTNGFIFDDFITLLDHIDLDRTTLLGPLAESLKNDTFNLECLKKLAEKYKTDTATFNKVFSKIGDEKFDTSAKGDDVIQAFEGKNIELEDRNLTKVLLMIDGAELISNCQKAIIFCDKHITNPDEYNIPTVFDKVTPTHTLTVLKELLKAKEQVALNNILPHIPEEKLHQCNGNPVIEIIIQNQDNLKANTIYKVLSRISGGKKDKNKIDSSKHKEVFKLCCNKPDLDINKFIDKCKNFKFKLDWLGWYKTYNPDRFYYVLTAIADDKFDKNNTGDAVLNKIRTLITDADMNFKRGNLKKILNLCQEKTNITEVDDLYPVFCRSRGYKEDVNALFDLVADASLNGNNFINKITSDQERGAQDDFVKTFYRKIKNETITISDKNIAKKFVWFTYIWYKQDSSLVNLKNKLKEDTDKTMVNGALKKETLKKFGGENEECNNFDAFEKKLREVLELKK